ncbi:MAG: 3-mercaptopyruvate:cyanide sulfurtransferase [uncultured bacterium]|nr:MAG: 3-mercaptopyruvate:cyanide sulfurtransferase [uncultured bacterium]
MPWLINAAQLEKFRKNQKNVVILDATWHMPGGEQCDAYQDFLHAHISGARFFDIDEFCDPEGYHPKMLTRDEKLIGEKLGALGITNEHKIIFYDNSKAHTSCRALWMMKVFGHNPNLLYVLDGGYESWEKFGGKIDTGEVRTTPRTYEVRYEAHFLRTLVQMKTNLHHPTEQVVDARHPVRYAGGPESRPGLRAGHIPRSFCFPFMTMFEADGRWKPIEKIRKQLTGIGVDLNYPIVTTCGSGTTASIINFALDLMNHTQHAVYNGSWTEWGAEKLYPGEASLAERPVETSIDK